MDFLNAKAAANNNLGLYNSEMTGNVYGGIVRNGSEGNFTYGIKSGLGNKPVNFVSFLDAVRFTNWLHNGQGTGSTETGAYTIAGDPSLITRNQGAQWFVPSFNEWFKAAYYQPASAGGDADDYWLFPTRSNEAPTRAIASDPSLNISNPGFNVANYDGGVGFFTSVGSAGPLSASYYGTYDQAGNATERTDNSRSVLGGSFGDFGVSSFSRPPAAVGLERFSLGFRVATIPEPSTVTLAAVGLIALVGVAAGRARRSVV